MLLAAVSIAPELPNALSLLYRPFRGQPWADALRHWESVIFSIAIAALISLVFYYGSRRRALIPSGLQNALEALVERLADFFNGILGPQGSHYLPFLGTLFVYIFTMNAFGLIPLMKSPSSNLNVTIAMAVCVFAYVQYLNIVNMGFFGFLYHMAGSPKDTLGWLFAPLMFPIELLTQLSRPFTLALRLYGNILGEKILVAFFAFLGITIFHFLPLQTPFMFLGVLTSLMQALVFTLLSTIYILLSAPHHEEEGNHSNH